jgi:hypothetical protein
MRVEYAAGEQEAEQLLVMPSEMLDSIGTTDWCSSWCATVIVPT